MSVPRPEYPRPQFVRTEWLNLNGYWQFEMDQGDSGIQRGVLERELSEKIVVPFCPESTLSGIGHKDFMNAVWYRKEVVIPKEWHGNEVLLHFQAVDYDTTVWVNGVEALRHRGGFTPFTVPLRGIAKPGEQATVVVRARDYSSRPQPRGKQSDQYGSHGCHYTRTTGIWQTVWMEPVPLVSLRRPRITPDVGNGAFRLTVPVTENRAGWTVCAVLSDDAGTVAAVQTSTEFDLSPALTLPIDSTRRRLWSVEDPFLYGIELTLMDETSAVVDRMSSYAGLRSISIEGRTVKINGRSVFQRLVLDQGYYRDGVITAPSDQALEDDIKLSQAAGFNGARLHQKVFEERFLYHADRLGYLVWGEFGDWGCGGYGPEAEHQQPGACYITQWLEAVERDYSHPSIIGWCPLNETHQIIGDGITVLDDVTRGMFLATKAFDSSRPVLDTSGYSHRVSQADIYDSHDYIVEPIFEDGFKNFAKRHSEMSSGEPFVNKGTMGGAFSIPYSGQPYFVSEFGGFKWNPDDNSSWGYGSSPLDLEEFYSRFSAVCGVLLDNPDMFGYCYTQLTDIYPEENGIYTFERGCKFNLERLHAIQSRRAAIEDEQQ